MKETILVTSGAGFIGSHICERYAKDGHTVIVVDDLSSGSHEGMESFIKRDNVYFYEVNMMDKSMLRIV